MKSCTVIECTRKINARGLCGLHYRRAQSLGLFGTKCSVEYCQKPTVGSGLCSTHYSRERNKNNRATINARQRVYLKQRRVDGKENKEKAGLRGEKYRRNNLEIFALKEKIRRAKKRANGGSFRKKDWLRMLNKYNGLCAYCYKKKATTIDHIIPVKRGGTSFIGNLLPACFSCNSSKQDKTIFEWKFWRKNERNAG